MSVDHKVTIITLGESGVGKSSLLLQFCKNTFIVAHISTCTDFYKKVIVLNNKRIKLEVWDTAGSERYKALAKDYYRRADGVLLTYDMTDLSSFIKLSSWLSELRELNEEATVFIVGNKVDLQHRNKVDRTTVERYARDEGLEFFETSAKDNENVQEVFRNLALKVLERKKISQFSQGNLVSTSAQTGSSLPCIINLDDDFGSKKRKKKRCC